MNTGKKLYRSRTDKTFAGVCGGLADYFNVDASLIRFITFLLIFFTQIGFILYIAAWLIIPQEPVNGQQISKTKIPIPLGIGILYEDVETEVPKGMEQDGRPETVLSDEDRAVNDIQNENQDDGSGIKSSPDRGGLKGPEDDIRQEIED